MPRSCSICDHEKTADITKAVAAGGSDRSVSSRFGVTKSAVHRHRNNCMRAPRRAQESPTAPSVNDTNGSLRFDTLTRAKLVSETLARYEDAKKKNDDKTAVQLLTLLSRLEEKDAEENDRADLDETMAQLSIDELRALAGQALCARCGDALSDNAQLSNASDTIESEVIS